MNEWEYELNEAGQATITSYRGKSRSVTIPAIIDGHAVTSIGSIYASCAITSVAIPDSVTSIGDNAFMSSRLASVTIPDSVVRIGGHAFSCSSLSTVSIGNGVTSIGLERSTNAPD